MNRVMLGGLHRFIFNNDVLGLGVTLVSVRIAIKITPLYSPVIL